MTCPTLGDGAAEQSLSAGHREQRADAHPASRLAKDRDIIGIAPKGGDILLHPGKGGDLVKQTEVGVTFPQEKEAVHSQAVVESDAHDPITGKVTAVIRWYRTCPVGERAAMNPDHHRQPGLSGVGSPNIEVQAVRTVDSRLREKDIERGKIRGLGDCWAIVKRVAHAVPWLGWLRWPKTMRAERRRRIGDAFESNHA